MAIYISENSLREVTYENNPIDRVLFPNLDCNNSGNIASAFNPDVLYSQGDYIFYNGKLYKFITDHEGAWNEADVIPVTITDELEKIWENTLIINSAEGAIASFPDGAEGVPVKKLTVEIVPVQDLHGQSSPYPAGGGKNLLNVTANSNTVNGVSFTVNPDGTVTVDGTPIDGNATFVVSGSSALTAMVDKSVVLNGNPMQSGARLQWWNYDGTSSAVIDYGSGTSAFTPTVDTGNVAIIIEAGTTANNVLFKPMIRLASVSDATFAPYSNICPITGWAEAKVTRTGVNVWNEEWEVGAYSSGTGEKTERQDTIRNKNLIPALPQTTYYAPLTVYNVFCYDANSNYLGTATYEYAITGYLWTTLPNTRYIAFRTDESKYGATYNHDISINYPSTDHVYHSGANNETYTIDLDGTVYGGTLDVTTGVLTVDRAMVDMGTLEWTKLDTSSGHYWFRSPLSVKNTPNTTTKPNMICSQYPTETSNDVYAGVQGVSKIQDYDFVVVCDMNYSDAAAFKTAMDGVQLVYELAEPQTVQLTPQQVTTLLGLNNIFADCGDVSVEYYANTKLYLENLGTPEEESVATTNITSGEYFMIGTNLYIATESIASGETIKVGTNCELTSIADALNELNS